jgi:rhamnosyltransferase
MINETPGKENICAVIVTYHPDACFPKRVECIAKQVGQLVIVDNHSNRSSVAMLQDICVRLKIELILNDGNWGVAAALNQGINLAHDLAFSWVLLFDQDTEPLDFMVHSLATVYEEYFEKDRLALIGSNFYEGNSSREYYKLGSVVNHLWVEQKTVITSGSLLRVSVFQEIGSFRNELFIDHVDHEYCLRARARGFKVIVTCAPIMKHSVGAVTWHKLLWRETKTSNHSALRRYYMARNDIVLAKGYIFNEPVWVLKTLYSRLNKLILICFFEKNKLVKLKLTALGFLDGLTSNFHRRIDQWMCDN